ncbi:MAG: hypothetical protein WCC04_18505 [Terriglobales bacterium]
MDSNEKDAPSALHGFAKDSMTVSHLENVMQKTVTLSHVAEALGGITQATSNTQQVQNQGTGAQPEPTPSQDQTENKS